MKRMMVLFLAAMMFAGMRLVWRSIAKRLRDVRNAEEEAFSPARSARTTCQAPSYVPNAEASIRSGSSVRRAADRASSNAKHATGKRC